MAIGARDFPAPFAILAALNKSCYDQIPIKLMRCCVVPMGMMTMTLHFTSPSETVATLAEGFLAQSASTDDELLLSKSSDS